MWHIIDGFRVYKRERERERVDVQLMGLVSKIWQGWESKTLRTPKVKSGWEIGVNNIRVKRRKREI